MSGAVDVSLMQPVYDSPIKVLVEEVADDMKSSQIMIPAKKPKKVKYLLKSLNSKTLTSGYKLGDGTSGKVYLATTN